MGLVRHWVWAAGCCCCARGRGAVRRDNRGQHGTGARWVRSLGSGARIERLEHQGQTVLTSDATPCGLFCATLVQRGHHGHAPSLPRRAARKATPTPTARAAIAANPPAHAAWPPPVSSAGHTHATGGRGVPGGATAGAVR